MTANLLVHLKAIEYIEFVTGNFATDWLLPATQLQFRNPTTSISLEGPEGMLLTLRKRIQVQARHFQNVNYFTL